MQKIYVDLGANEGSSLLKQSVNFPQHVIYAFEPNPALLPSLHAITLRLKKPVHVIWGAAWVYDGEIDLFMSSRNESSTVVPGKVTHQPQVWPPIDYDKPTRVPCFDFGTWLSRMCGGATVVIKMDIEGAEYAVLERMLDTGTIDLIDDLFCEWHHDRFPQISESRHLAIVDKVKSRTRLHPWI